MFTTNPDKEYLITGSLNVSLSLSDITYCFHELHISMKKVNHLLYFQVKRCSQCQHSARVKTIAAELNSITAESPWDLIGVDMIGPFTKTDSDNVYIDLHNDRLIH